MSLVDDLLSTSEPFSRNGYAWTLRACARDTGFTPGGGWAQTMCNRLYVYGLVHWVSTSEFPPYFKEFHATSKGKLVIQAVDDRNYAALMLLVG